MPKKVESYQSNDGRFHASEIEAVRHEVLLALWTALPELRDRKMLVENNIDKIAAILKPLGSHIPDPEGSHAEAPEPEDHGGCDCAASMAGNGPPHHPTCPMFRAVRLAHG